MRGDTYKPSTEGHSHGVSHEDDLIEVGSDKHTSYIPRAHVQFLEQAGIRVVPIDYRLSTEERFALYDQLNGVYMPGDSHMTVTD